MLLMLHLHMIRKSVLLYLHMLRQPGLLFLLMPLLLWCWQWWRCSFRLGIVHALLLWPLLCMLWDAEVVWRCLRTLL